MATLILTGQKEELNNSSNEILSGEWVKYNNHNLKNKPTIEYHWSDYTKVEKDYNYLKELYSKLIPSFTKYLNIYHQENRPIRYWEIIIGPWVVDILSMLWDRWEIINRCLKEDINEIYISKHNQEALINSDYMDLMISRVSKDDHKWNHMIFSEILKFINPNNIVLKEILIDQKQNYNSFNSHLKFRKKKTFIKFLNFIFKNRKILFYENQLTFCNKILFSWYSKSPIISIPSFDVNFDLNIKVDRKNIQELSFLTSNNFEKFIKIFLPKIIPLSYLEGYEKILKISEKIDLNPKIIISHYGQVSNDLFKIWLANMHLKNKKIVICYHGGSLEKYAFLNYYENICDLLLSRYKFNKKKVLQLPPSFLIKKKKILKKNSGKNILFLSHNQMIYTYRVHDGPLGSEMINYFNFFDSFLNKIKKKITSNILLRCNPYRDNLGFKNKFLNLTLVLNFQRIKILIKIWKTLKLL